MTPSRESPAHPPEAIHTPRLRLERWSRDHAPRLERALAESVEVLKPWIPWRVAEPAPAPELELRLARFRAEFEEGREWAYAVVHTSDDELLGGASLHPRSAFARVVFASADRIELGYWLRAGTTGNGYASEAAQALLDVSRTLPGMLRAEIRCNRQNASSAGVAKRLNFALEQIAGDEMLWTYAFEH